MAEQIVSGVLVDQGGQATILPAGSVVIICPASVDHFVTLEVKAQIEAELRELGIRSVVLLWPVNIWAVENARS